MEKKWRIFQKQNLELACGLSILLWRTENIPPPHSGTIYNSQTPTKRWVEEDAIQWSITSSKRRYSTNTHYAVLKEARTTSYKWDGFLYVKYHGRANPQVKITQRRRHGGRGRDRWEATGYRLGEMRNSRIRGQWRTRLTNGLSGTEWYIWNDSRSVSVLPQ